MICAGLDIGSRALKGVLLDAADGSVLADAVLDQTVNQAALARELLGEMLSAAGARREDLVCVTATGYGRHGVDFADRAVTEITCHARGVRHLVPGVRTVVDIGGQDSKMISLDERGVVQDFSMNDRCAAGTGCFLEVTAKRLGLSLSELGDRARRSRTPAAISSMCVVFAETEIIGLLAAGVSPDDIVAGVQAAVATRIATMAPRTVGTPVVFTGGVALIPGMAAALEEVLGTAVSVSPRPQLTGALGAALLGLDGRRPGG